jgi:hypothetical protein
MCIASEELSNATQHCKQDPIEVFPEMKPRSIIPNFHIHVSVSDLYIPMIGPTVLLNI